MNPLKLLKLKPTSIQFIQEIPINAPPQKAWNALINFRGWFHFDHGPSQFAKVSLEPHIGGKFVSQSREQDVFMLHGIVAHWEPGKLLRINGPMGMTHLPVSNTMIWELQPQKGGKATLLRFCQRAYGLMPPDAQKNYQKGWKQLLPHIKELAEKSGKKK